MEAVARVNDESRRDLFAKAAEQMRMQPAIIEKDFWVCWVLDALFSSPQWGDKMVFKGGTSLSKAFHIINRFSEDIDLILDWGLLGVTGNEPWEMRSNTSQDKYCKEINAKAASYLAKTLVPAFAGELEKKLGYKIPVIATGEEVIISYPKAFSLGYLRPEVVLEIGPLAAWVPHAPFDITPYAAEKIPDMFIKKSARVTTILAERTFWEKATILHKLASQGSIPLRHSRHYYDLALLAQSDKKSLALGDLKLLHEVIAFKQRFYRSPKAQYEKAIPGSFKLIPDAALLPLVNDDYNKTKEMIFGTPPTFESIVQTLKTLEDEINALRNP
jgi:hypothetical protein